MDPYAHTTPDGIHRPPPLGDNRANPGNSQISPSPSTMLPNLPYQHLPGSDPLQQALIYKQESNHEEYQNRQDPHLGLDTSRSSHGSLNLPDAALVLAPSKQLFGRLWDVADRHLQLEFASVHAFYQRAMHQEREESGQRLKQLQAAAATAHQTLRESEEERQRLVFANKRDVDALAHVQALVDARAAKIQIFEDQQQRAALELQAIASENERLRAENKHYKELLQSRAAKISKMHEEEVTAMTIRTRLFAENRRLTEEWTLAQKALFKMEYILTRKQPGEGMPVSGVQAPRAAEPLIPSEARGLPKAGESTESRNGVDTEREVVR